MDTSSAIRIREPLRATQDVADHWTKYRRSFQCAWNRRGRRSTRSGGSTARSAGTVVTLKARPRTAPRRPIARISRATVQRATGMASRRSWRQTFFWRRRRRRSWRRARGGSRLGAAHHVEREPAVALDRGGEHGAHFDSCEGICSNTSRTARSRTSAGYLLGLPIAPILSTLGASGKVAAIQLAVFDWPFLCRDRRRRGRPRRA
jgi:hypothetical protein